MFLSLVSILNVKQMFSESHVGADCFGTLFEFWHFTLFFSIRCV